MNIADKIANLICENGGEPCEVCRAKATKVNDWLASEEYGQVITVRRTDYKQNNLPESITYWTFGFEIIQPTKREEK